MNRKDPRFTTVYDNTLCCTIPPSNTLIIPRYAQLDFFDVQPGYMPARPSKYDLRSNHYVLQNLNTEGLGHYASPPLAEETLRARLK